MQYDYLMTSYRGLVDVDGRPEAFGIIDSPARVETALSSARRRNFIGVTVA